MIIIDAISMVLGLIIGSFLNVCICRIPKGESIQFPPSHCTRCDHVLKPKDLVPVFSYTYLRGKCRYCGEKISLQYPIIEVLNGLLYVISIRQFGLSGWGIMGCLLSSVMLVLTLIDWEEMILPTSVIMFGTVGAFICRGVMSYYQSDWQIMWEGVYGGIVGYLLLASVFYITLKVFKKEGMGYGDVRYLGMIGCFTSWTGVLLTLFISSIIGAIYGIIQLRIKKESVPFPYGPFLSIAGWLAFFYGDQLIAWYLGLFLI